MERKKSDLNFLICPTIRFGSLLTTKREMCLYPAPYPYATNRLMPYQIALLALLTLTFLGQAREIRVGEDVKTIAAAIKIAQPGDTIHLEPIVYRDYAGFYAKKGEPGRPITLDGHGATLEGSDSLDPGAWTEVAPGLFEAKDLLPRLDDAMIMRWFFLWGGKMNHMSRTSKGKKAPFVLPQDLRPGEWTFIRDHARDKTGSNQIFGSFFVRLPEGQRLADAHIFVPVRSAGVQLSGDNAHLVIRNITATHPYNDGFNIHGDCRDVVFENIRAIECGDDGISAHESAEYRVDGLVAIGNSTGITDTGTAKTSYRHVFLADNLAFDLYFLNDGRYALTDAVVLSSAEHALQVVGGNGQHSELRLNNVLIRRVGSKGAAVIAKNASLFARRFTLEGDELRVDGQFEFDGSIAERQALIDSIVPEEYLNRIAQ